MLIAVCRSQDKADSLCKELEDLNPGSQAIFIKKDISILKNIDEVCEELQRREKKINILFLSAGYMSLSGRKGESGSLPCD
jgi:short-subunit dehydrogenase